MDSAIEALRDPLWQALGALFTLVTIGAALIVYLLQRQRKILKYDVVSEAGLIRTAAGGLAGHVEITFQGRRVENVHSIVLRFVCQGSVPIRSDDYEEPITVTFARQSEVLSVAPAGSSPTRLPVHVEIQGSMFEVKPLLLNPKDEFSLNALVNAHQPGEVSVNARIAGVQEVGRLREWRVSQVFASATGVILAMLGLGAGSLLASPEVLLPILAALSVTLILAGLAGFAARSRER